MITIESFLKIDGDFVRVDLFAGKIQDPNYVDGALTLVVDEQEFMGTELWDLVDILWAYFIQALTAALQGRTSSFGFPDQPITITIEPMARIQKLKLKLEYPGVSRRIAVDAQDFVRAFCAAGRNFLANMNRINPRKSGDYLLDLADLAEIERLAPGFARA